MTAVRHIDHGDGDSWTVCARCGSSDVDRVDCWNCGGEGYRDGVDLMEEDPLWYGPDDIERCGECDGQGGWWECYSCQRAAVASAQNCGS